MKAMSCVARVLLVDDLVADVRPVEAGDEAAAPLRESAASTISSRVGSSAVAVSAIRGTSGKRSAQHRQPHVFGAEIVAPLRDAMRLVDREQRDPALAEQVQAARHQQPFRRDVEQVELACEQPPFDRGGFCEGQRGIQRRGLDAGLAQACDLVVHQRDQRRDDDAAALAQQRRQLVAQRFAAAGRHQHEAIAAAGDMRDDLLLLAAKAGQAEDGVQDGEGGAVGAEADMEPDGRGGPLMGGPLDSEGVATGPPATYC